MTSLSCVDEGFSIARLTVKTPIHASENGFGGLVDHLTPHWVTLTTTPLKGMGNT